MNDSSNRPDSHDLEPEEEETEHARTGPKALRLDDPHALIKFVHDRTNEVEAAAKAATDGPWAFVGYDDTGWAMVAQPENGRQVVARSGSDDAIHMALHHPALALRRVEAARYLLARFERKLKSWDRHVAARTQFRSDIAHQEETGVWAADYDRSAWSHSLSREEDYLVPMVSHFETLVRFEAVVYSDHEDFQPEWRP